MATEERSAAALMMQQIEEALKEPGVDTQKLLRARSLAAEAARSPAGTHRTELLRDARALLRQATGGGA